MSRHSDTNAAIAHLRRCLRRMSLASCFDHSAAPEVARALLETLRRADARRQAAQAAREGER